MKTCQKCKRVLPLDAFCVCNANSDGLANRCRECSHNYYLARAEHYKAKAKQYVRDNPELVSEQKRKYRAKNAERIASGQRAWRLANREAIAAKKRDEQRRNRPHYNAYLRQKRAADPSYKVAANQRGRINRAIRGGRKAGHTIELLGCTPEQLRTHIESLWTEGMSWDNYGTNGWHVDHIIPCDAFELQNSEEQEVCFHYTNLQPLWAHENLSKNNFLPWCRSESRVKREGVMRNVL